MKKIFAILICFVICAFSFSAYASEDIGYYKLGKNMSLNIEKIPSDEAVLVIGQYESDKLIDFDIVDIPNPEKGYKSAGIALTPGVEYKFYVWDNIESANSILNCLELNSESPDYIYPPAEEGYVEIWANKDK